MLKNNSLFQLEIRLFPRTNSNQYKWLSRTNKMAYVRQKYCGIVGCKYKTGVPVGSENVTMLRIPTDAERRQQWIENIQNHQKFTMIDEKTMRFSVCNLHFEAEKMRKANGRLVVEGPPTIFPKINNVTRTPESPSLAAIQMQERKTESIPLIEPQSCLEQYKKRKTTYPSVCIEKTKVRHGSAPLAKVLAKMSAIEVSHRKEITMLRAELDEYKNKCENLQQQLAMYQAREKNQQFNAH